MLELFSTTEAWVSLLTLTSLEIVLGLDNIIFIAILAGRLPVAQRDQARKMGLAAALVSRLALLSVISFLVQLTQPLISVFGKDFSGKSLILLAGGLFLLYKATREMHEKLESPKEENAKTNGKIVTLGGIIAQIALLDIVFSIDSVITAVGLTDHLSIMVIANLIALGIMIWASRFIADFVEEHPTVKVLALSFLMMIGLVLVGESFGAHIPKGYIYFSMGFSVMVEAFNIRMGKVAVKRQSIDSKS